MYKLFFFFPMADIMAIHDENKTKNRQIPLCFTIMLTYCISFDWNPDFNLHFSF